jgi:hypothetical protein
MVANLHYFGALQYFFFICLPKKCPFLLLQLNEKQIPSQIDGLAEGRERGREEG